MINPLTIILLALVGLCLVVMWGYIHRVRLRLDALEDEMRQSVLIIDDLRDALYGL